VDVLVLDACDMFLNDVVGPDLFGDYIRSCMTAVCIERPAGHDAVELDSVLSRNKAPLGDDGIRFCCRFSQCRCCEQSGDTGCGRLNETPSIDTHGSASLPWVVLRASKEGRTDLVIPIRDG